MASPNIAFDSIPSSLRKPGKYFEFNARLAVRTLPTNLQRVLIVAQMSAAGTGLANTPIQVFDAEVAAGLFGRGSQAHRMVKAAIKANPYVQLYVMPIADNGAGVAATGTITVTGTATANGTAVVSVAGVDIPVLFASGDTATVAAGKIVAVINATIDLPVTAANAAGVVTLTARNKGTVGNAVALATAMATAGLAAAVAAFSAGATNPLLDTPLATVAQGGHEILVVPYTDSTSLVALRTHLAFVSGPMEQRRAIGCIGFTGSLANATTLAAALNAERETQALLPGTTTPGEELAAAYAAVVAGEEDPSRPLNTLELVGVNPPPVANRLTRTEQESALANGVTPLEVGPGGRVQIVRAITTYTVNPAAVPDIAWLDLTTVRTMDYVARACRTRIELRFPREKLSVRTEQRVKSELLDVLIKLEELEIVENVLANKDRLIVERDSQDPNRLNASIPVDIVNGLHVFAGRLDLIL